MSGEEVLAQLEALRRDLQNSQVSRTSQAADRRLRANYTSGGCSNPTFVGRTYNGGTRIQITYNGDYRHITYFGWTSIGGMWSSADESVGRFEYLQSSNGTTTASGTFGFQRPAPYVSDFTQTIIMGAQQFGLIKGKHYIYASGAPGDGYSPDCLTSASGWV